MGWGFLEKLKNVTAFKKADLIIQIKEAQI